MNGWLKLYRALLEHAVWGLSEGQRCVWITCLLLANVKAGQWWDGKQQVDIPAGSFITSQDHLAEAAKVSRKTVRCALSNLTRIGSIRANIRANKWTLIEIINWPTYQGSEEEKGQDKGRPRAHQGPTEGHNVRRKEGKKERKDPPLPPHGWAGPFAHAPGPEAGDGPGTDLLTPEQSDRLTALEGWFHGRADDGRSWDCHGWLLHRVRTGIASRIDLPPVDLAECCLVAVEAVRDRWEEVRGSPVAYAGGTVERLIQEAVIRRRQAEHEARKREPVIHPDILAKLDAGRSKGQQPAGLESIGSILRPPVNQPESGGAGEPAEDLPFTR